MSRKPKVALSQDFLLNLARLPAAVQRKVLKWAIRFQTDPTANGFNYETIRSARDVHLKSGRIDGDWRGIVFVPPRSDLYVLLYVDHHDAAYRWAAHRKLTINPVTGVMQVVMLSRAKRDAVWPVFKEYRAQLASRRLKEVDDAYRDAAQLIAKDRHYLYSAIVVDETQDFLPRRCVCCGP